MFALKDLWLGAMLMAIMASSPAKAAQGVESVFQASNPAIEMRLETLRKEIRTKGHQFNVGYSSAMDRSIDRLCGLKEPTDWLSQAPVERLSATLQALPASFDWRTQNGTTPVKNQKTCGDCWAFGTVGPIESQIKLKCGVDIDLSEQYLTSCNTDGWGCNGGWWAHDYHLDKPGINETQAGAVLESASPFIATQAPCGGPYQHSYKITNWTYVAGQPLPDVQAIKQAIHTYGPISAAVHVGPKFQAYSSGIFDADEPGQVNHAIVIVGWNDDLGTDNGYWILRNSWGSGWGESGYMRIRYGKSQVGYSANYVEFACAGPSPAPPPATLLPDLAGSFTNITTYASGHQVAGMLKLANAGQANAGAFKVLLYLSNDGSTKTLFLGQFNLTGLATGASANLRFNKSSSATLFSGKYLLAVIDSDSQVKESNETNNKAVKVVP